MKTVKQNLHRRRSLLTVKLIVLLVLSGCSGGSLTTREKGAGIGAVGGAGAGALVGSAVGRPGAGALVGDQLQGQENINHQQQQQIQANQAEIERQRLELQRMKRQREY